jgi:hypothetical protein
LTGGKGKGLSIIEGRLLKREVVDAVIFNRGTTGGGGD